MSKYDRPIHTAKEEVTEQTYVITVVMKSGNELRHCIPATEAEIAAVYSALGDRNTGKVKLWTTTNTLIFVPVNSIDFIAAKKIVDE